MGNLLTAKFKTKKQAIWAVGIAWVVVALIMIGVSYYCATFRSYEKIFMWENFWDALVFILALPGISIVLTGINTIIDDGAVLNSISLIISAICWLLFVPWISIFLVKTRNILFYILFFLFVSLVLFIWTGVVLFIF